MKKVISCILVLVFCFLAPFSSLATENTDKRIENASTFVDTVASKVETILGAMEPHKSDYGLGGVDFSDMSLGSEIPAYEITSAGLSEISDIHYFPVLYNGEWVATATVSYSVYGDMNTVVSIKYAVDYAEIKSSSAGNMSSETESVALVFDSTNTYLYAGDNSDVVESFPEVDYREPLDTELSIALPYAAAVEAERSLAVSNIDELIAFETSSNVGSSIGGNVISSMDSSQAVWLGVPSKTQPTAYSCWAASMASILGYYGTSTLPLSVVATVGVGVNDPLSVSDCKVAFETYYNCWCGKYGNSTYSFYYNLIMDNLIAENDTLASPILANFNNAGSSVGHMVVIQGYVNYSSTQTFSYMDPADGYFRMGDVPSNGALTIVDNGTTKSLIAAVAVYSS
jgi:hypothetical protein